MTGWQDGDGRQRERNNFSWNPIQSPVPGIFTCIKNLSEVSEGNVKILRVYSWTLSVVLFLSKAPSLLCFKTQRFGDWILSPSSSKTYSVGQSIELDTSTCVGTIRRIHLSSDDFYSDSSLVLVLRGQIHESLMCLFNNTQIFFHHLKTCYLVSVQTSFDFPAWLCLLCSHVPGADRYWPSFCMVRYFLSDQALHNSSILIFLHPFAG
jgi:hypothetical protein